MMANYIITQNSEAAMVVQSVAEYEQTQATLAMLQVTAIGDQEIVAGKTKPAKNVFAQIRHKMGLKIDV